ncbi:TonB-dependent siderophore receptor [Aquitalea magnusonii]|uniref:Outer membrane receptor for ferric coprogen and ferric-rhodotorulic acid n=1 Tax=Aquitalea magnusonii TaxID=332411 RepID=A0A318J6F6_9NEIS|nr:TonB-dependent siderophore receptor [Aquitalea magnusonii]PXX42192.1 outer membrane receptor for ferric coprogen and ferric-rhodotorulic acid [Aquitalea magnusonii]
MKQRYPSMGLALLVSALFSNAALAQDVTVNIAPQSLASALTGLAGQTGLQLLFASQELDGQHSAGLNGTMSAEQALARLLQDSGLQARKTAAGSYIIVKAANPANAQLMPEVLVTASALDSYKADKAAIFGKKPVSLREIANSVSVVGKQQMEDQHMTTVADAMQQATGVTVIANDTLSNQYLIRGYNSVGVMYDGVTSYNGLSPSHQFDLPLYESIEVLRGPAGLLRGVGEPGGIVNLVKKKPQKDFAASWEASTGSWSNNRLVGDVTGAMNESGTVQGRLIASSEDRNYFYDHTHSNKWLLSGMLRFELSPQTTFDISYTGQNQTVKDPWSGLPTYTTTDSSGHYQLLKVSPSTFNAPDWGRTSYNTQELSAALEHKFGNEWAARLNVNHRVQELYYKYAYTSSGLNPLTNTIDYSTMRGDYTYTRDGMDLSLSGPLEMWGRKHDMLLGFNVDEYNSKGRSGRGPTYSGVDYASGNSLAEPVINYTSGSESNTRQSGFYTQGRLHLTDATTLLLGARTTTFLAKSHNIAPSTFTDWKDGAKASNRVTPYGGLLYDFSQQVTLYASYANIFVPQTQQKADGSTLDPRVGRQYEVGAKGEFLDSRLGATLAFFNIRDKNRAYADPAYPSSNYYLNAGEIESQGVELEVQGKVNSRFDVTAGYTYMTTTYLSDPSNQGKTYSIQTPRNQFKLWSNYSFDDTGWLKGYSLGGGLIAQSRAQSSRGWSDEVVNSGYVVANARIGYQFNKNYSLALNINNLFDTRYYASVGTPNIYNFYGEPRNVMLTLRGKY